MNSRHGRIALLLLVVFAAISLISQGSEPSKTCDLTLKGGDLRLRGKALFHMGSKIVLYTKNPSTDPTAWQEAIRGQSRSRNGKPIEIEDIGASAVRFDFQAPTQQATCNRKASTLDLHGHSYWPLFKWKVEDATVEIFSEDTTVLEARESPKTEKPMAEVVLSIDSSAYHYLLVRVTDAQGNECIARLRCSAAPDDVQIER